MSRHRTTAARAARRNVRRTLRQQRAGVLRGAVPALRADGALYAPYFRCGVGAHHRAAVCPHGSTQRDARRPAAAAGERPLHIATSDVQGDVRRLRRKVTSGPESCGPPAEFHGETGLLFNPAEGHTLVAGAVAPQILAGRGEFPQPFCDRGEQIAGHMPVRPQ